MYRVRVNLVTVCARKHPTCHHCTRYDSVGQQIVQVQQAKRQVHAARIRVGDTCLYCRLSYLVWATSKGVVMAAAMTPVKDPHNAACHGSSCVEARGHTISSFEMDACACFNYMCVLHTCNDLCR